MKPLKLTMVFLLATTFVLYADEAPPADPTAELVTLRAENKMLRATVEKQAVEIKRLKAELVALRAENKMLRATVEKQAAEIERLNTELASNLSRENTTQAAETQPTVNKPAKEPTERPSATQPFMMTEAEKLAARRLISMPTPRSTVTADTSHEQVLADAGLAMSKKEYANAIELLEKLLRDPTLEPNNRLAATSLLSICYSVQSLD